MHPQGFNLTLLPVARGEGGSHGWSLLSPSRAKWAADGEDSLVRFTPERKNEMYSRFDAVLFPELEGQMTNLLREYKTDRQQLFPHTLEEATTTASSP